MHRLPPVALNRKDYARTSPTKPWQRKLTGFSDHDGRRAKRAQRQQFRKLDALELMNWAVDMKQLLCRYSARTNSAAIELL